MFQVICKRVGSSSSWSCSVLFKPLFPQKAFTSHAEKSGIIWQPGHPTNRFKIFVSQHKEYGDTDSRRKCQKEKNLASSGKKNQIPKSISNSVYGPCSPLFSLFLLSVGSGFRRECLIHTIVGESHQIQHRSLSS